MNTNNNKYKTELEFLVFDEKTQLNNNNNNNSNPKSDLLLNNNKISLTPSAQIKTACSSSSYSYSNSSPSCQMIDTTLKQTTTTITTNPNENITENSNRFEIKQTSNLLDSILKRNSLKIDIINTDDLEHQNSSNLTMNSKYTSSSTNSGGVGMFHPTWDEWKQQRATTTQKQTTQQKSDKNNIESVSTSTSSSKDYKNNLYDKNQTSKTIIEEYYTENNSKTSSSSQMTKEDFYNPPSPILIRNSGTNQLEYIHQASFKQKGPRHPVQGIDFLPVREPSPVNLSSCTLAKEPPLEIKTQNEVRQFPKEKSPSPPTQSQPSLPPTPPTPEPKPIVLEQISQKKIKTILSTRKESAPNLTGWRTESEDDSDDQRRLLARASGSIPIEYISIRRDPKPDDKKNDKGKKSITTGTNTSNDRGKKIAATNTDQDELPQYNLHVSLDSLFVKQRQEASTTTDIKNKNASTETSEVYHKDACTVTDVEKSPTPPPPPPPPQPKPQPVEQPPQQDKIIYRKSRYTEWETASNPPVESTYRLEILAKSPSVSRTRRETHYQQSFNNVKNYNVMPVRQTTYSINHTIDDDDRIIFGQNNNSVYHHEEYHTRRSGSFPCLRPVFIEQQSNIGNTRRYIKQTTTNFAPIVSRHVEQVTYAPSQIELISMPLITQTKYYNSNLLNEQFNDFNSKFNQIFGKSSNFEMQGKTQRFYKYSRTTTDNGQQVRNYIQQQQQPSFSEFKERVSSSSYSKGPIIEIPVTPTSTMGKSSTSQFFSSRQASTSNGPIITSLSRNGSTSNLSNNYFMSQQRAESSFEPVVQRMTSSKVIKSRAEEEEELVNMRSESERQFRPINETITRESHFRSSSTNGQAPQISSNYSSNVRANSFNSNLLNTSASQKKQQNYSYEYKTASSSSSSKNI
ncbi:unnamed protein product [Brachionus calyciflorus]|uniref:Uncharacterized protein n=1 Tax=Brachionus calyciflorus TaxID=104777 RepID=A0A813Y343_9BILA|nr:unnamed protein product [Brachionus calyciflorus]